MFSRLIERTAMSLAVAILASIGAVFVLIGSFYYLSALIEPGPAGLAMGGALLLMALLLAALNRSRAQTRTEAKPESMPPAILPLMQTVWKERPLLCLGLISAAGLILARRPKTLTDIAAIVAQFLRPPASGA